MKARKYIRYLFDQFTIIIIMGLDGIYDRYIGCMLCITVIHMKTLVLITLKKN